MVGASVAFAKSCDMSMPTGSGAGDRDTRSRGGFVRSTNADATNPRKVDFTNYVSLHQNL